MILKSSGVIENVSESDTFRATTGNLSHELVL
jgi:hypothetical protein